MKLAAQNESPESPCCKTRWGFSFIHHLLSVKVILTKTMHPPKWMQHLQLCSGPSKHITAALGPTPMPCSSVGSRAPLGEKGSLCIPFATMLRGSQLGHYMACSLQTAGNGFWKQNEFRVLPVTPTAQEPTTSPICNSPHLLSTCHCYQPNSDHFYMTEAFLCPQGFRGTIP